jgi:hypothetical protein
VASTLRPVWTNRPSVYAVWAATAESPEWIAAHVNTLLEQLRAAFGVSSWDTHTGVPWEGSPEWSAEFVRRCVVRDRPTADDREGEAFPSEGYSFIVSGNGPELGFQIRVAAGAAVVGRRLPTHTLLVQLNEITPGGLTASAGDIVCQAVAETWQPATLVLSDDPVRQLARRGNWKIAVGYRMWISSEVGAVHQLSDQLAATGLAGGTMISAPDIWPASRVVEATTATLRENGLDEVPH